MFAPPTAIYTHASPLTAICCKVLEHILTSSIRTHLRHNNILHVNQHGFKSKRKVHHQRLINKLNNNGIRNIGYEFLGNIQQQVVLNGINSYKLATDSCVLQGTVLAYIMFTFHQ